MTATSTYKPTGNSLIDGVLMGTKWAVTSLTYSFPTSASFYGSNYGSGEPNSGFKALNAQQQDFIKSVVLVNYAAIANLSFTQVTESSTTQATLRYAESNVPGTAWGYFPYTGSTGGDVWFNNSTGRYDDPLKGNYAGLTMLHETGHALGLKHPHTTYGSFPIVPAAYDSLEYSVMSYRSYVGGATSGGYTNADDSYPQSLMMLDIAAIQQLYGANFTTNAGDTVYRWDATTGRESINGVADTSNLAGNKIFLTIWDGGGNDTYDFSNYTTNLSVNLQPGAWTTVSAAQLADLGDGHFAAGNIANAMLYQGNTASLIENAIGGSGNDTIIGNTANNRLTGGLGNDTLDGQGGINTAVYSGTSAQYQWVKNADGSYTVTGIEGTDTLINIQKLAFSNTTVDLGTPVQANVAPVAVVDSYTVARNGKITITAANGVLANDTDANGDKLTAALVTGVSRGTLSLKSDGSFTYTAPRNYTGTVTFTYKDSDGSLSSNTATVTIKIGGTTSSGSAGRGNGARDNGADNMPLPASLMAALDNAPAAPAEPDRFPHWGEHPSPPAVHAAGPQFFGELSAVMSHLGAPQALLPGVGFPAEDLHSLDVAGLPDFAHRFYSEFSLG